MKNAIVDLIVHINSGYVPVTLILHEGQGTPLELRDTEDRVVIELVRVSTPEEARDEVLARIDREKKPGEGS